jgi:hypothetical protein
MAGCGLPGNGMRALISDTASDRLSVFINEDRNKTKLAASAQSTDTTIFIRDTTGFKINGWACIACPDVDTIYRMVQHVGPCASGADTLLLSYPLNVGSFSDTINTRVYPADCIYYFIATGTDNRELRRWKNNQSLNLGSRLDSMNIVLKNDAGVAVGGLTAKNAGVLTVVLGGYVGADCDRIFLADSTEINIRNN